jgi:hypothetical protein
VPIKQHMTEREQGEGGEMTEREDGPLSAGNEPALDDTPLTPPVEDEPVPGPSRVGCRTDLRGWAGAHLHGAVRPRRRAVGRGRPPGRWC